MKPPKQMPTVIFIIASIFVLSACIVKPLPPPAPGSLVTKIMPAIEVQIVQTSARQDGENIVVDGQVERKVTGGRSVITGHIDIEIIDMGGKVINKVVTNFSPKTIPERSGETSSFTTRIPIVAPQGGVVSIMFHNVDHNN